MTSIASIFKNSAVILGVDYSNHPDCVGTFYPTDEEIILIKNQYDYAKGKLKKGKRATDFEKEVKQKKKPEILEKLGKLKLQKEGLGVVNETTKDIDDEIEQLKNEYNTLD